MRFVLPVTAGVDKIEAAVNTMILDITTIKTALITEIMVILFIDIINDWLPTIETKMIPSLS